MNLAYTPTTKTTIKTTCKTKTIFISAAALLLAGFSSIAIADSEYSHQHHGQNHSQHRADSHAPIGVMGDHLHKEGEFMLSYRYMWMDMDGSRDGDNNISDQQVLQDFRITPTEMTMQMHMLGAMYATSDDLTWMLMIPYVSKEMDHLTRMGTQFTTEADGIGDVSLTALIKFRDSEFDGSTHNTHFNVGLSFPTGSIDERDQTPMGERTLPFPMQVGSGTYDLKLGFTHLAMLHNWSFGEQISLVKRLGYNDRDYRYGDTFNITAWGAYNWNSMFSLSLRFEYSSWQDVDANNASSGNMIPTARADLRAGRRLDIALGGNILFHGGFRLAAEVALPVYQNLDGPQLETDLTARLGAQFAF